jgi:hypothetical protein
VKFTRTAVTVVAVERLRLKRKNTSVAGDVVVNLFVTCHRLWLPRVTASGVVTLMVFELPLVPFPLYALTR